MVLHKDEGPTLEKLTSVSDDRGRQAVNAALFAFLFTIWGWLEWSAHVFWGAGQEWLEYPLLSLPGNLAITLEWLLLLLVVIAPSALASSLLRRLSAGSLFRLCGGALLVLDGSAFLMVAASALLTAGYGETGLVFRVVLYGSLILPVPLVVTVSLIRALRRLHLALRQATGGASIPRCSSNGAG